MSHIPDETIEKLLENNPASTGGSRLRVALNRIYRAKGGTPQMLDQLMDFARKHKLVRPEIWANLESDEVVMLAAIVVLAAGLNKETIKQFE